MKKLKSRIGIWSFIIFMQLSFHYVTLAAEDEEFIRKQIGTYATVSNFIWHAVTSGGSVADYKSATFSARESLVYGIKTSILEKLETKNFLGAIRTPTLFDRLIDDCPSCYTWGNPKTHLREKTPALNEYVDESVRRCFQGFIEDSLFLKSFNLAVAYSERNPALSAEWLQQIRERSAARVDNIARKVALLSIIAPDLAAEERAQALAIIHSFPEGHELRGHLQACFDNILTAPRPDVPDAAQLESIRGLAERIVGK